MQHWHFLKSTGEMGTPRQGHLEWILVRSWLASEVEPLTSETELRNKQQILI